MPISKTIFHYEPWQLCPNNLCVVFAIHISLHPFHYLFTKPLSLTLFIRNNVMINQNKFSKIIFKIIYLLDFSWCTNYAQPPIEECISIALIISIFIANKINPFKTMFIHNQNKTIMTNNQAQQFCKIHSLPIPKSMINKSTY